MSTVIRFKFAPKKALAALYWMLCQEDRLDLHTLLKACYFADKSHLNAYTRPVFGATYRAMRFGPVPLEIYDMAKGEPLWLAEIDLERYPWKLLGYHVERCSNEEPNLDALSESDVEALGEGFKKSRGMTFNERTAATHGPDWEAANLGLMRYEDMIEDGRPDKSEFTSYLLENAHRIRL
jgi:hypothetical protein